MRIITHKKQEEIHKCIAECQVLVNRYVEDMAAYRRITENLAELTDLIGGADALEAVMEIQSDYYDGGEIR